MDSGIPGALKRRRKELGLNQSEAARQLEVDVSTISYWESGSFSPGVDKLDRIAAFLGWRLARVLKAVHLARTTRQKRAA